MMMRDGDDFDVIVGFDGIHDAVGKSTNATAMNRRFHAFVACRILADPFNCLHNVRAKPPAQFDTFTPIASDGVIKFVLRFNMPGNGHADDSLDS